MGEVGHGSMSSSQVEHLDTTENDDGSIGVDLSDLPSSVKADTVRDSVDSVARYCRRKKKKLRVKVPREYFSFIPVLSQMGYDKISHAETAEPMYVALSDDKSLQVASDFTLMQQTSFECHMARGNIASSSNPTFNQTPDPILTVQTRWESVCEQGREFQHFIPTFRLGPTGMGNGLQDFSVGPEIPKSGVQTKKSPHPANESGERLPKRPRGPRRGPDFEDEEKGLVLRLKFEYLQNQANEGKGHKWSTFVSDNMRKSGHDRLPKAVQGQWDSLKKSRDALVRKFPQGTGYWDMTMDEKKARKKDHDRDFPLTFKLEWYVDMENIEKQMELKSAAKKQTRRDGQEGVFSQSLASTTTVSTNFADVGSSDVNIQASAQGSDEDLLEKSQRSGAPQSYNGDLTFLHSLREKDNQKMFITMQEQQAVWKKLMENSSLSGRGTWDDAVLHPNIRPELADADLAGCNALENEEYLHW